MSWLSTLSGLLAGLVGREMWEWLPALTRTLILLVTLPLPSERREIRRSEWRGELEHFGQKRISALLWVLSLLPVCLWETATYPGAFRRLASWVEHLLMVYMVLGGSFIWIAIEVSADWHLPAFERAVFVTVASPVMGFAFIVGSSIALPLLLASPFILILRWTEARARRNS